MRNMALIILFSICIHTYAASDEADRLLSYLQSQLKEARTAAASDKASGIEKVPDVSSLVGMKIDKLSQWLGSGSDTGEVVTYSFYHIPITHVGGGYSLIIEYDDNGIITNAEWLATE